MNLPSGRPYFLYSSINFETVNAVRDDLRSKIIQFNKELFKHGHSVIPKSDLDLTDYNCKSQVAMKDEPNCQLFFNAGVQVGDKFWMMQIETIACKWSKFIKVQGWGDILQNKTQSHNPHEPEKNKIAQMLLFCIHVEITHQPCWL